MLASTETFVARVAARAGVGVDCATRATHSTLSGIGTYLRLGHRELVADELPTTLAAAVLATDSHAPPQESVLVRAMTAGHARELIASVCRVLAEELSFEAIDAIRAALPPTIAILFGPPGSVTTRASSVFRDPARSHVASVRAHRHSIAEANPHGDTKLSSSRGSTREIATARVATARR